MDLKTQYAIIGLFLSGHYSFNKKTNAVTSATSKTILNPRRHGNALSYRFTLGFNNHLNISLYKFLYLMHYGIVNPLGEFYFKDGDNTNLDIKNIGFKNPDHIIPLDTKKEILELFSKGWWFKKISRKVKVSATAVKEIVNKEFGYVDPQHYVKSKKFLDAMENELKHMKK